jgi:hypothetical protein
VEADGAVVALEACAHLDIGASVTRARFVAEIVDGVTAGALLPALIFFDGILAAVAAELTEALENAREEEKKKKR